MTVLFFSSSSFFLKSKTGLHHLITDSIMRTKSCKLWKSFTAQLLQVIIAMLLIWTAANDNKPERATLIHLCPRCCLNYSGLTSNTYFSFVLPSPSPLHYFQLNETAKQLMEIDKPMPANAPGPSSEPAPLGPCTPGPSPSASPSNGNGSGHRRSEGKKNAKKRHSFSALSVSQRAAQFNNRHSMEISHPVLISSSDPRAAARIQVQAHTMMYIIAPKSLY